MPPSGFSDRYMDSVFYLWYENNRPASVRLRNLIPDDEKGNKPTRLTLENWHRDYGWEQRADAIDGEASHQLDQTVIQRRIKMYEELEQVGRLTLEAGKSYIETNGIQSDNAAIKAIVAGAEMIMQSVGVAESYARIATMTNAQIDNAFRNLLNRGQNDAEVADSDEVDIISDLDEDTPSDNSEEPI
jgi:hypothetical protein